MTKHEPVRKRKGARQKTEPQANRDAPLRTKGSPLARRPDPLSRSSEGDFRLLETKEESLVPVRTTLTGTAREGRRHPNHTPGSGSGLGWGELREGRYRTGPGRREEGYRHRCVCRPDNSRRGDDEGPSTSVGVTRGDRRIKSRKAFHEGHCDSGAGSGPLR